MFRSLSNKKEKIIKNKIEDINEKMGYSSLDSSLGKNIDYVNKLFKDVDILRIKHVNNNYQDNLKCCIAYSDGVVDNAIINDNIIKPLMLATISLTGKDIVDTVMNQIIQVSGTKKTFNVKDIIESISYGDTVLFIEGVAQAIIINTKKFSVRVVSEPENEKNISGPKEGFTESLMVNLSLIRRRVLTSELKMKFYILGQRTNTKVCICYIDGIVNKQILSELYRRLEKINMDAVLDTNYITEFIKDSQLSPFRTTGKTEKPDVIVGKLMEGRIAIFLDGTPDVLTIPYLFVENFQSSEDYYLNFYYSSFSRLMRILGFFLTSAVPGIYIAIVAFQHEMLPMSLFINVAAERQSVPLPAALEAVIMLVIFDILRETGIRMPSNIGQALSIVGALVIGQAAVDAKFVAAPMIIMVALTGITNLLVPKMNAPVIIIRFALLFLSSVFGFFGLILGISCVLIHVINLRSFGIPQITLSGKLQYQELKDIFIRAPWWQMILRPGLSKDKVRIKNGKYKNG